MVGFQLLKQRYKLSDAESSAFMDHCLQLGGELVKLNEDDAGTMRYAQMAPEGFQKLR